MSDVKHKKQEGLLDNIYSIKDLYVVLLKKDYEKYLLHKDQNMTTVFNPNFYFIVEKFLVNKSDGFAYNSEVYTECVTSEDIFKRESGVEFQKIPPIFEEIFPVPSEYFTEEELNLGSITSTRVFQIFQEYNLNQTRQIRDDKIKKIGNR